jgi:hypothetical protein
MFSVSCGPSISRAGVTTLSSDGSALIRLPP